MSDFFDQVGRDLGDAVEHRRHLPWHVRIRSSRRRNVVVGVLAALVVATPAVAAVAHWFGSGAPDRFPMSSASQLSGRELPGTTAQLLGLRVADPHGGPAWGMRMLRTTRGDTCIQIGRVQGDQVGSLGIDHAWNDDHLFHAFPADAVTEDCGTTDGAGHAFLNLSDAALPSSAEPTFGASGPQARSCEPANQGHRSQPICPAGAMRIVFAGLLGPDATDVTYRSPDGMTKTEPTSGPDGAYLIVVTRTRSTCEHYGWGNPDELASCAGESFSGASPSRGAVTAVSYRRHAACIVKRHGLTGQGCPPVGYVADRSPEITHAELATPITVHVTHGRRWCSRTGPYRANAFSWIACDTSVPAGYQRFDMTSRGPVDAGVLVNISLTAREPVTSSRSWYEIHIDYPRSCGSGGVGGKLGLGNIHAGQTLRFQDFEDARCTGTFHAAIGYQPSAGPVMQAEAGGGQPGRDGSTRVARFTYTTTR